MANSERHNFNEEERRYLTTINSRIICKRLREETDLFYLPYLGHETGYGEGDVCLEESIKDGKEVFKFYIIDHFCKFDYQEFDNIEDAIKTLVNYYAKDELVSNPEKVESIFRETLNLPKHKNKDLTLKREL